MKNTIFTLFFSFLLFSNLNAQNHRCSTVKLHEKRLAENPMLLERIQQSELETQKWISEHPTSLKSNQIITIPIVVHVVYNLDKENISDAQIRSQIDILNKDFRLKNSNALPASHPFKQYTSDTEIEFCLASKDPLGNSTSGITRTKTTQVSFSDADDKVKDATKGGVNNWDPTKYLNLWVCNLEGNLLGYATFPSDLTYYKSTDGVVIRHQVFGNIGTAGTEGFDVNKSGRTATHEIGHWLNLIHIWGDADCGDDLVSDTKPSKSENYDCPTFPHNANVCTGSDANGEMFMNYMDYVDDNCMNMFTVGQGLRMRAALNGDRKAMLTSAVCSSLNIQEILDGHSLSINPNPNNGNFELHAANYYEGAMKLELLDLVGGKIKDLNDIEHFPCQINVNDLPNGGYFLKITSGSQSTIKKIFISK